MHWHANWQVNHSLERSVERLASGTLALPAYLELALISVEYVSAGWVIWRAGLARHQLARPRRRLPRGHTLGE